MSILAMINQKGGVAKTTTAINLGSCLVELGKKVLLIDMDPQANLTQGLGVSGFDVSIYDVLTSEMPLSDAIFETSIENLHIIASDIKLANAEIELASVLGRESVLKDAFEGFTEEYDYILIDCNPSLGLLTINALTAADEIIIPLEPSVFALQGIEQLIKVYQLIKKKLNPKLAIRGVLLTRVDSRTKISKDFKEELNEIFEDKVFETVIHQNVKIAEAQIENKPINHFDKTSKGYLEYIELAKELINRG